MYCKMCGNLLDDTDLVCKVCGFELDESKVKQEHAGIALTLEKVEEVTSNPSDHEHDATQSQSKEPEEQKNEQSEEPSGSDKEFSWNIYEFPKPKKTDTIDFEWGEDPYKALRARQEEKSELLTFLVPEAEAEVESQVEPEEVISGKELETDLFQDIMDRCQDGDSLKEGFGVDKFFTFSKKNEEFQKLLDKEYEKIKRNGNNIPARQEPIMPVLDPMTSEVILPHDISLETSTAAMKNPNLSTLLQSAETEVEEANIDAIEEPILADSHEIMKEPKHEIAETKQEIAEIVQEAVQEPKHELKQEDVQTPDSSHLSHNIDRGGLNEMIAARADFFGAGQDGKEDFAKKYDTVEIKVNSSKPVKVQVAMGKEQHSFTEKESKPSIEIPLMEVMEVKKPQTHGEVENLPPIILPFDNLEDEKIEKKGTFIKVAAGILIVLFIIELSFLGISFFAPQSQAASLIREKGNAAMESVIEWKGDFVGWIAGITGKEDKEKAIEATAEKEDEKKQTKTPQVVAPSLVPVEDKSLLIEDQKNINKNIVTVRANDKLKFVQGKDYGIADINQSMPIMNNVWSAPKEGSPVYFDHEIVGTLMAFDSQWVDYVNGGSDAVLQLVKTGSQAERNAKTFSKVGKIKETFNLLEIGEIRKGETCYYVWCHEEILITEGSQSTGKTYNWIYSLEPIGEKMQIVNYYQF